MLDAKWIQNDPAGQIQKKMALSTDQVPCHDVE